jgi:hypothetical protein
MRTRVAVTTTSRRPNRPWMRFGLLLLAVSAAATATVAAGTSQAGSQPAPSIVGRTVLPDGTIEIRYDDGTTRRIPKETVESEAQAVGGGGGGGAPAAAGAGGEGLLPAPPPAWLADPATGEAFRDALKEYYAYRVSGLQHRRRVFEWQLASSKIIFGVVLLLVAAGVAFAALQFYVGLKKRRPADVTTELDVSTTGIKVSSPVLGVIILVISLAFFYLYLVYVYPISEIF